MRAGIGLLLVLVLGGTGCCRLCHRWCDDRDDGCRRYPPRDRDGCYCAPAPRYSPGCDCGPDEQRLPPTPVPTAQTSRSPDDRPTGDPKYDRTPARPTGAYGGSGN